MIIQVCVGSACHLKGSQQVVELMQKAVEDYKLQDDVTLVGSFCTGKCNRIGVTVQVDDDIYTGITSENFNDFLKENVLNRVGKE